MSIYCDITKKLGAFTLKVKFETENETVALMGASGCGKSMTLRCIAGIEKPDTGKIMIDGKTVFDSEKKINLTPQKRKTGFLFQDYALFPNMTVEKNILAVMPKDKRGEVKEVLDRFHLSGLGEHYPSQLSGGQKQRCALARMIVSEPDILMLDEPFSALDSFLRWQMEQEVASVIRQFGKTVLFVSHDRDEVYRISDRVVVISQGHNEPILTKQQLYQHPQTYADALLTGCKNIFPVTNSELGITAAEYGIHLPKDIFTGNPDFIGIRAKRMVPGHQVEGDSKALLLPYEIVQVTEEVFGYILMVKVNEGSLPIRWELSKALYEQLDDHPKVLAIPYDEILLLHK